MRGFSLSSICRIGWVTAAWLCCTCASYSQSTLFNVLGSHHADEAYYIEPTNDGNYLMVGGYERDGFDTAELLVFKMEPDGDTLWVKTFGGAVDVTELNVDDESKHLTNGNLGYKIHEKEDGSFVICGSENFFGEGMADGFLLSIDQNGEYLWSKAYGGSGADIFFDMLVVQDGYILAGLTESFGSDTRSGYCIKVSESGDTMWSSIIDDSFIDEYHAIDAFGSGFVAGGSTFDGKGESSDIRVTSFNGAGQIQWEFTFGGGQNEFCSGILATADSTILVTGASWSYGAGDSDVILMELDANGELLWSKVYGGTSIDDATGLFEGSDEHYFVTGFSSSFGAGNDDMLVMKVDATGDPVWSRVYGGALYDYAQHVYEEENGELLILGYGSSYDTPDDNPFVDNDIIIMRTDEFGESACHSELVDLVVTDVAPSISVMNSSTLSGTYVNTPNPVVGYTFADLWDGCSIPDGLSELNAAGRMSLGPNPARDIARITLPELLSSTGVVKVISNQGEIIQSTHLSFEKGTTHIWLTELPSAIYTIVVEIEGSIYSSRLMVE